MIKILYYHEMKLLKYCLSICTVSFHHWCKKMFFLFNWANLPFNVYAWAFNQSMIDFPWLIICSIVTADTEWYLGLCEDLCGGASSLSTITPRPTASLVARGSTLTWPHFTLSEHVSLSHVAHSGVSIRWLAELADVFQAWTSVNRLTRW